VYVAGWVQDELFVSIDETIDLKIAALRAHKSQMLDWDPEPMVKQWASERAKGKEMLYAEGFRVVTLVNDEDWEKTKGRVRMDT
jgi:LmbE family N-acetylglucosaminyl deacetylase